MYFSRQQLLQVFCFPIDALPLNELRKQKNFATCEHSWDTFPPSHSLLPPLLCQRDLSVAFNNPAAFALHFILGSVLLVSLSMLGLPSAKCFTVNVLHGVNTLVPSGINEQSLLCEFWYYSTQEEILLPS